MAVRTLGAKFVLDGEKEYKQAISELNTGNATLRTEMQKLQAEYKGSSESTEFLTKKGELLNRQLLQQQDKVQTLREAVANAAKQYGEADQRTQKWQQQLNKAEAEEYNLRNQIDETNQAMESQDKKMEGLGDTVNALGQKFGVQLPKELTTAMNSMEGFSAGTVAVIGVVAAAVAGVIEAVKKLGEITIEVAADVDETLSQSVITGVPAELLQAWDYAAPLIDVDVGTITDSMTKLEKSMDSARDGNTAMQESFASLGVSVTDADGNLRDAQEVFYEAIDALGQIENATERDAKSMEIFGKSAKELNPLIVAGSGALNEYAEEAKALGFVLDEYQLAKLGEVDDAYQKLQMTIEANRKQMAADFAPAARDAINLFSDAVQKAGEYLKRSGLIENLAEIFQTLVDIIRSVGEFLQSIPGFESGLDTMRNVLKGVAIVFATIADTMKFIIGMMPTMWGSGMLMEGLGFGSNQSNLQRVLYGDKSDTTGNWYNPQTGRYEGNYGRNATGNDNWRGGLTWVGEAGPELVALPGGSQILNAQDSRIGGDTFYITIDAASVKEFNDIVEMAQSARVRERMR